MIERDPNFYMECEKLKSKPKKAKQLKKPAIASAPVYSAQPKKFPWLIAAYVLGFSIFCYCVVKWLVVTVMDMEKAEQAVIQIPLKDAA